MNQRKTFSMGQQAFSVAMANVNAAMARLRLVVEHRGGTMLPLTEPLTIALCDDRRIEFDTTEDFKLDWWIDGRSPHDRLMKLLEQYPGPAERDRQFRDSIARNDLAELISALPPAKVAELLRTLKADSSPVAGADAVDPGGEAVADAFGGAVVQRDDDPAPGVSINSEDAKFPATGRRKHFDFDPAFIGEDIVPVAAVVHSDSPVETSEPSA